MNLYNFVLQSEKNKKSFVPTISFGIVLMALLFSNAATGSFWIDEDDFDEEWIDFDFGHSCEQLDYTPPFILERLLDESKQGNWPTFCQVESEESCDRFDEPVKSFGFLRNSLSEEGFCQFFPHLDSYHGLPYIEQNADQLEPALDYIVF